MIFPIERESENSRFHPAFEWFGVEEEIFLLCGSFCLSMPEVHTQEFTDVRLLGCVYACVCVCVCLRRLSESQTDLFPRCVYECVCVCVCVSVCV